MLRSSGRRTADRLEALGRAGLLGAILLAPLPFGAVVGWAWSSLALLLGLILVLAGVARLLTDRPLPPATRDVALGCAILASPALLQLLPLPSGIVAVVSPATAHLYSLSSVPDAAAPSSPWLHLTQDVHATTAALLWGAACTAAALIVTLLFGGRRLHGLLTAVVLLGTLQAFYGLTEFLSGRQRILAYEKVHYTDSVTGTYINRNHFAGLMLLALPLATAGFVSQLKAARRAGSPEEVRRRLLALSKPAVGRAVLLGLAVALMGAALLLSYSRAGVLIGAVAGLVLLFSLGAVRPRLMAAVVPIVALAVLPILTRGPGRLAGLGVTLPAEVTAPSGRAAVWKASLPMLVDHALIGTGLGTFAIAWPRYRPPEVRLAYSHAHQDYLEWAVETGLLGMIAGSVVLIALVHRISQAFRTRQPQMDPALVTGLAVGLSALAVHGLVDFNGHIPANLFLAAVLGGAVLTVASPDPIPDQLLTSGQR